MKILRKLNTSVDNLGSLLVWFLYDEKDSELFNTDHIRANLDEKEKMGKWKGWYTSTYVLDDKLNFEFIIHMIVMHSLAKL